MNTVTGLRCCECGQDYPVTPVHVCEMCFGPLEVEYDYALVRRVMSRQTVAARPASLWRYHELLPLSRPPTIGLHSGCTPLVKADRLAAALGLEELYVKDDSVNHPTFSYKDRVVPVALSKALEFGFETVSCASTGNLANSVSAHAARAGLRCCIFIPADLEQGKVVGSMIYGPQTVAIRGNYDDVNRLCSEIADKYGWAFVNITLRPYYIEGAKTYAFEIAEQLGWRLPQHVVVPTAGGTLLPKVAKAFDELQTVGLVEGGPRPTLYTAQAAGSAPVVAALHTGTDRIAPVKPDTIATSIAIGNPADGYAVLQAVRESGGWGEAVTDQDIVAGMHLLAHTEGIFTEPAGGTTVAATKKLIEQGRIPRDESVVICITGNGYKTVEAALGQLAKPQTIDARLAEFDALYQATTPLAKVRIPALPSS